MKTNRTIETPSRERITDDMQGEQYGAVAAATPVCRHRWCKAAECRHEAKDFLTSARAGVGVARKGRKNRGSEGERGRMRVSGCRESGSLRTRQGQRRPFSIESGSPVGYNNGLGSDKWESLV